MRPPIPPPQPAVLVSGPSLYEDKALKNKEVEKEKDPEPKPLTMKTQALSSDVELIAQKRHAEAMHRTSYLGRVMRGEKKMKRFLRSCGGQVIFSLFFYIFCLYILIFFCSSTVRMK